MAEFDYSLLKGLQNLLKTNKPHENSDSEEDEFPLKTDYQSVTGNTPKTVVEVNRPSEYNIREDSDYVYDEEPFPSLPTPEYEFIYNQRINTEDVFLQMGNKSPATTSCEDLVVRIRMPLETTVLVDQMQLDITETGINLRTSAYRLQLPLPHSVDPDQGSAKWDAEKKILSVVLRLQREFDFVNF